MENKRYRTGYACGTFEQLSRENIRLLKACRVHCEKLVVGLVSDDLFLRMENRRAEAAFKERREVLEALRYVDEVVEIPVNFGGTRDAYRLHHFDCQFSGSDYIDDPDWLMEKEFLERHGAEMVFFPYTEGTSSSKIKALIEKRLS